ncbi:hypothetical protein CLOHYLEM_04700 [[Clostridium] hylemonae DSM 15053]|uniref:Uncharacterized protein n=1 Tax=[Clostridium] hylemonae DSM 15053 TaxID=553973 RepID=C0BY13_9FIRM|nr:hypothetical protein CLOHYLEM_04700 [[Clostridium] hylemonae DSM 15053]
MIIDSLFSTNSDYTKRDRAKANWGRRFLKNLRPQFAFALSLFEISGS